MPPITSFTPVLTYLPEDFWLTHLKQVRERLERKTQAEVDNFMAAGGSIRDKYVLIWKQQMERRLQVPQLGYGFSGNTKHNNELLQECDRVRGRTMAGGASGSDRHRPCNRGEQYRMVCLTCRFRNGIRQGDNPSSMCSAARDPLLQKHTHIDVHNDDVPKVDVT